jgi:hypothetical protein
MARRSYLARIAQPLGSGEPRVWSIPRPNAEDARPAATLDAAERPPARAGEAPAASPTTASLFPPGEAAAPAAPIAVRRETPTAPPRRSPRPMRARSAVVDAAAALDSAPRRRGVERGPGTVVERPRTAEAVSQAMQRSDPADGAAVREPEGAPAVESSPSAPPRTPPTRRPAEPPDGPAWFDRAEEAISAPRREPPAPPRASAAPASRLHIGTIEIRASTPPPAAAPLPPAQPAAMAPAPAAGGPIGRAYPWRYGLVQG